MGDTGNHQHQRSGRRARRGMLIVTRGTGTRTSCKNDHSTTTTRRGVQSFLTGTLVLFLATATHVRMTRSLFYAMEEPFLQWDSGMIPTTRQLNDIGVPATTSTASTVWVTSTTSSNGRLQQMSNDKSTSSRKNNTTTIPQHFIFVEPEKEMPEHVVENVYNTIRIYREHWDNPVAPVYVYGLPECQEAIKGSTQPSLLDYFNGEQHGPYRSDICRAAALERRGGYYFDNDQQIVEPFPLEGNITLATAHQFDNKGLFNSFIFVAKEHPVTTRALELMLAYYQGKHKLHSLMGTSILLDAYSQQPEQVKHQCYLLNEIHLDSPSHKKRYKDFPRLEGVGCCCNFVVEDTRRGRIFSYSRMVGAGKNCEFPPNQTSSVL